MLTGDVHISNGEMVVRRKKVEDEREKLGPSPLTAIFFHLISLLSSPLSHDVLISLFCFPCIQLVLSGQYIEFLGVFAGCKYLILSPIHHLLSFHNDDIFPPASEPLQMMLSWHMNALELNNTDFFPSFALIILLEL